MDCLKGKPHQAFLRSWAELKSSWSEEEEKKNFSLHFPFWPIFHFLNANRLVCDAAQASNFILFFLPSRSFILVILFCFTLMIPPLLGCVSCCSFSYLAGTVALVAFIFFVAQVYFFFVCFYFFYKLPALDCFCCCINSCFS